MTPTSSLAAVQAPLLLLLLTVTLAQATVIGDNQTFTNGGAGNTPSQEDTQLCWGRSNTNLTYCLALGNTGPGSLKLCQWNEFCYPKVDLCWSRNQSACAQLNYCYFEVDRGSCYSRNHTCQLDNMRSPSACAANSLCEWRRQCSDNQNLRCDTQCNTLRTSCQNNA